MKRWLTLKSCLVIGVIVGVIAGPGAACVNCPDTDPADAYRFLNSLADNWVLESGRVEVSDDDLRITYETADGSSWEAVYRRAEQ